MTKTPERLWVVFDRSGLPQFAAPWSAIAHEHINDAIDQHIPDAGGWVVREYRTHRPINWRTGVPRAETRRRCDNLFALRLPDGSVLRDCVPQFDGGWWWEGAGAGEKLIDPEFLGVRWCPEDEMPNEGETT